jgi:hypothetical protein
MFYLIIRLTLGIILFLCDIILEFDKYFPLNLCHTNIFVENKYFFTPINVFQC